MLTKIKNKKSLRVTPRYYQQQGNRMGEKSTPASDRKKML
jgi:hypothetical protein